MFIWSSMNKLAFFLFLLVVSLYLFRWYHLSGSDKFDLIMWWCCYYQVMHQNADFGFKILSIYWDRFICCGKLGTHMFSTSHVLFKPRILIVLALVRTIWCLLWHVSMCQIRLFECLLCYQYYYDLRGSTHRLIVKISVVKVISWGLGYTGRCLRSAFSSVEFVAPVAPKSLSLQLHEGCYWYFQLFSYICTVWGCL